MEVFRIKCFTYDEEGNEEFEEIEICCDTILICNEAGETLTGTY